MTLIDEVLSKSNIDEALLNLSSKKDTAGADGMPISELKNYWDMNSQRIIETVKSGKYETGNILQYEILSSNGKKREVSVMCAVDRLIGRALVQVLSPIVETQLSDRCFSYRKEKGTLDIAKFAARAIEQGNVWGGELDISHFFDSINQDILIAKLAGIFEESRIDRLIKAFINCTYDNGDGLYRKTVGIPQGSSLSPLLSNIYLMNFDSIMEKHHRNYCRFGDDIRIYTSTKKEAEEAVKEAKELLHNIELECNDKKCGVYFALNRPHFGYELIKNAEEVLVLRKRKERKDTFVAWHRTALRKIDADYHIVSSGILTKKDYNLLFENDEQKRYLPVEATEALNLYSDIVFASNFFEYANKEGLYVNIFSKKGEYVGSFRPESKARNIKVEIEQLKLLQDEKKHLCLAKTFQKANIFNIRAAVRYYGRRKKDSQLHIAIEKISMLMEKINDATSIQQLMMYEAQARQDYYHCFNIVMNNRDFFFEARTRRPPKDAINAMISFGNTLLYSRIANIIRMTSLDIRFGILHNSAHRSESLNLDVADLFKPIIVDRTIFTLVNKGIIDADKHFEELDCGVFLNVEGKRLFINELRKKLEQTVRVGDKVYSYDQLITQEIRKIQQHFSNGNKYKPYKYVN